MSSLKLVLAFPLSLRRQQSSVPADTPTTVIPTVLTKQNIQMLQGLHGLCRFLYSQELLQTDWWRPDFNFQCLHQQFFGLAPPFGHLLLDRSQQRLNNLNWNWVDGSVYTYSNWATGQPADGSCAVVDKRSYSWAAVSCDTTLPFICELDAPSPTTTVKTSSSTCPTSKPCPACATCPTVSPLTTPKPCPICPTQKPCPTCPACPTSPKPTACPLTTPKPCPACPKYDRNKCDTEWNYFPTTGHCYKTFAKNSTQFYITHSDAETACRSYGAHLTSIDSQEESDYVGAISASGMEQPWWAQVWIGLQRHSESWYWTDGTQVNYTFFAENWPLPRNVSYIFSDRTSSTFSNKKWDSCFSGDRLRAYVCKKASKY